MSASIFESNYFKGIQKYTPLESRCAIQGDPDASDRCRQKIQGVINQVLAETQEKISDNRADAYEAFLKNVETINGEYASLNYGNPFSDSIDQMRQKLTAYKQAKKDQAFEKTVSVVTNFDFAKQYSPQVTARAESSLEAFANELIQERLPNFSNEKKAQAIDITKGIRAIGEHLQSEKILQIADRLQPAVIKTSPVFRGLLSDNPIKIETAQDIERIVPTINSLIASLAPFFKELREEETKKLLKRLYELEDALIKAGANGNKSPIASSIEQLELYLHRPPRGCWPTPQAPIASRSSSSSSSSVSSLRGRFEKSAISSTQEIRPQRPAAQKKVATPEQQRQRVLTKIQTNLRNLPKMSQNEVVEEISFLRSHRESFSLEDQKGIDALIEALSILRDPTAFKPSFEELALMDHWEKQLLQFGISRTSYEQTISPVQKELRNQLIHTITSNLSSLSNLSDELSEALPRLNRDGIVQRFLQAEVTMRQAKPFSKQIAINLANTVLHITNYKMQAMAHLRQKWNGIVQNLDKNTKGAFSRIIEQLAYCNLGKRMESIEKNLIRHYLNSFMTSDFSKQATTLSTGEYKNILERLQAKEPTDYNEYLKLIYKEISPYLKWIEQHALFIKKVYDQSSDFNRNMGDGTCERNSQDRYKRLLQTPYLPSEAIDLGSSAPGRFNQAMTNQAIQLRRQNPEEALKLLKTTYDRAGLEIRNIIPVKAAVGQTPHIALYEKLLQLAIDQNESLFLLALDSDDDSPGHAINIQIDLTKPIFRFIDDNIGVVECPDEQKFRKALLSWLETSYPDLVSFHLYLFNALS